MRSLPWLEPSLPFLDYLQAWYSDLERMDLSQAVEEPTRTAIVSVDVINGFCHEGSLSSPRVKAIIEPIVKLMQEAWGLGLRNIILTQDTHEPEAVEFAQFPPHCIRGTNESETVPELQGLPFFDQIEIFEKNSIQPGLNTGLNEWTLQHPEVETYIVVGDCTDLCTYQLAMYFRLDANARQLNRNVIVPANCVDTYDMSVETAKQLGAIPHDAELIHRIFLYHMMLNGVQVVSSLG